MLRKQAGGLNVSSFFAINQAMLGKWWYNWYVNRDARCNKLVRAKYSCTRSDSLGDALSKKRVSSVLNGNIQVNNVNGFNSAMSSGNFRQILGDGRTTLFREDIWDGNERLCLQFSRLFKISKLKRLTIKVFCDIWSNSATLTSSLQRRQLREWELQEALKLNDIIEWMVFSVGSDKLVWKESNKPCNMADRRHFLRSSVSHFHVSDQGAQNTIWRLKIPSKIQFFLWKVEHGVLPSKTFLESRMHNMLVNFTCDICKQSSEDHDHIFWSCSFAEKVRSEQLDWWGVKNELQIHSSVNLWPWLNWFSNQSVKIGWGISIASTLWSLWLNRNKGFFEGKFYKVDEVVCLVKFKERSWCHISNLIHNIIIFSCMWDVNPSGAKVIMLLFKKDSSILQQLFLDFLMGRSC